MARSGLDTVPPRVGRSTVGIIEAAGNLEDGSGMIGRSARGMIGKAMRHDDSLDE